jgi:hypothetical protein
LSPLSIAAGLYSTGMFTLEIEKDKTEKIIYSNWKKKNLFKINRESQKKKKKTLKPIFRKNQC